MQLIVGSTAAKNFYPEFKEPKDLDIWIAFEDDFKKPESDKKVEIKDVSEHSNLVDFMYEAIRYGEICDPSLLYTLKLSHSFWDIRWLKTAQDILFFQSKRLKHSDYYLKSLKTDWETIHGKKRAYLNKSNEDFFKDNVNRVYEHDDIHKAMMYYDEPLYNKCKKDTSKALLSKEIFDNWEEHDRIRLCREESYVTAIERFIIPSGFKADPTTAYRKAIWKLCTSMTKGFFPEYIMTHLTELWTPEKDYVQQFKSQEHKCRRVS